LESALVSSQLFYAKSACRRNDKVAPQSAYTGTAVSEAQRQSFTVNTEEDGQRLDRVVAAQCPELSRTRVQELIDEGLALLNGKAAKGSHKVRAGDVIEVVAQERPALRAEAENIPIEVLYEDGDVLAVNKPAGMSVHAGAGNSHGTLVNALLGRGQSLSRGGDELRPGIVHRLDKETSGIVLVAKNDLAHARLSEAFRQRTIQKIYVALVQGELKEEGGRIELEIARDPKRRTRMTAKRTGSLANAREARTDWRVLCRIDATSLLEAELHTGRTHQIRVHFAALRHPVVGDRLYGASEKLQVGRATLPALARNFLHAAKIAFAQPRTSEIIQLTAPLPDELRVYLARLAALVGDNPARIDAALKGFL
jgi:23S rRNA pseudouridine1911/1915/1917 synthase